MSNGEPGFMARNWLASVSAILAAASVGGLIQMHSMVAVIEDRMATQRDLIHDNKVDADNVPILITQFGQMNNQLSSIDKRLADISKQFNEFKVQYERDRR